MKRTTVVGVALLLGAGRALAGCAADPGSAAPEAGATDPAPEILIGAAWPWALADAQGILYPQGLEMALDEVNRAGGVGGRALRLVFEDDGGSVNEGLMLAERLASDPRILAVIGHLHSHVTVPAAAVYDRAGVVLLAPTATDPVLTARGYRNVFRTSVTDEETGRQLAEYAAAAGHRRVAIYFVRSSYGAALANAFERAAGRLGIAVVSRASYEPAAAFDARSFEPTLRQWQHLEMDAVFLAAEVPLAGHLIAEMRRMGLDQPVLGGDAMAGPPLVTAGGEAVEGTVVTTPFYSGDPRPEVVRFTSAFEDRYGTPPDAGAALAYDALHVLARALSEAAEPTRHALADALREAPSWDGVTGPIAFDERGDLQIRSITRLIVRDGRFESIAAHEVAP